MSKKPNHSNVSAPTPYDQRAISDIQRAADTSSDPEKIAHMKRAQRAFSKQQSQHNKK